MRTGGMLRGAGVVCLLAFLAPLVNHARSLPLQLLPSIPGYIPVYIRHGDQPLEEINPALAEAFHETPASPKSIRPDLVPDRADPNSEGDEEILVGESGKNTVYPVHVRRSDGDGSSKAKDDEDDRGIARDLNAADAPRLLSIYELHDAENEKSHRREHARRRPVSVSGSSKDGIIRVNLIPTTSKEYPTSTTRAEKHEDEPNDVYDLLPQFSTDVEKYNDSMKVHEEAVKKQNESSNISNVHKISPIVSTNKNTDIQQDKMNANDTNESHDSNSQSELPNRNNKSTGNFVPVGKVGTIIVDESVTFRSDLPPIKQLPQFSDEQDDNEDDETAAEYSEDYEEAEEYSEEADEEIIKNQADLSNISNVYKTGPIISPYNSTGAQQDISNSTSDTNIDETNDSHDTNSQSELPNRNSKKPGNFLPVGKVGTIIVDESVTFRSDLPPIKDLSQLSSEQSANKPVAKSDTAVGVAAETDRVEDRVVKEQNAWENLSNVHKISPIVSTDKNPDNRGSVLT